MKWTWQALEIVQEDLGKNKDCLSVIGSFKSSQEDPILIHQRIAFTTYMDFCYLI